MVERTTASKLLIKPGATVWISDQAQVGLLEPLPEGARWTDDLRFRPLKPGEPPFNPGG